MQQDLEDITAGERFNMRTLLGRVASWLQAEPQISRDLAVVAGRLSAAHLQSLQEAILRNVFLIELVKVPKIDSTKARVRWYEQLNNDPRWCSYDECLEIARDLLHELASGWLDDPAHLEELQLFFDHSLLPYEAPLDYARVETGQRIHFRGNLIWAADPLTLRTLRLRARLTEPEQPLAALFKNALDDKIKIKTYLTDRALTGVHKSNREKRWETHPASVQFASRRACLGIEYTLLLQLCSFDGFPVDVQRGLQNVGVLPEVIETYRCPVTQDPLRFNDFKEELLNPQHGKASFQVGHLNPLKFVPAEQVTAGVAMEGHSAANIGWISADGNRIQGPLSLDQTRALLRRISQNYESRGLV